MSEQVTIGEEKVSIIVTRKTAGDLLVSQQSVERWYATSREADMAVVRTLSLLAQTSRERDSA